MNWMGFDVETSGSPHDYALQPWRVAQGTAWVTSTVSLDPARRVKIDMRMDVGDVRVAMERMLRHAIKHDLRIVGWNVMFDIQWLIAYGLLDLVQQVKWLDGMLLWKHAVLEPDGGVSVTKRFKFGLKECVSLVLPEHAGYEDGVDYHATDAASLTVLHDYNVRDVKFTLVCARHWWERLNDRQRATALIEADCLPTLALANYEGLTIDTLKARDVEVAERAKAQRELAKLTILGANSTVIASSAKLASLLFDQWKVPSTKITATGSRSTDKEVLTTLALDDPRVASILTYRNTTNSVKKFIEAPLAAARYNGDGKARPQAKLFGAYTARLSYASSQMGAVPGAKPGTWKKGKLPIGFALHQMQRGPLYRQLVIAPPGYVLVEFDAAGQEFRWMALLSGDATMLRLCRPGEDAHSFMGAAIANVPYAALMADVHSLDKAIAGIAKPRRQMGKVGNLCISEGALILTDRGPVQIEMVRDDDKVWDGDTFVDHDGVKFSGTFRTIQHDGVRGTPDHKVMCDGEWTTLENAAEYGRRIQSAMGTGWARQGRAAVRIVDGLVRRAVSEIRRALRQRALRLRAGARGELEVLGGRSLDTVQVLQSSRGSGGTRSARHDVAGRLYLAQACERLVPTVQEPECAELAQLRGARDRMSLCVGEGGGGVGQDELAARDLQQAGYRQDQQRWTLRAWKSALGYASAEPGEPKIARTYDIVNCGSRTRFAANGRVVHNSAQYRTSPPTLRKVANIQYGMTMSEAEAEHIIRTYKATYPGVPRYWNNQIQFGRTNAYVENLAGRRLRLRGNWMGRGTGWALESATINWPIQSIGAEQKFLALRDTAPIVRGYGARLALDLHDGLYFYAPIATVDKFMVEMKDTLDHLDYVGAWGYTPTIPLPFDAKVGSSWGSLKEVTF